MRLYLLQKIALSIRNNAEKFLQGITSNTLDQPHNAFLDFHGKIVATFDQIQVETDKYLIVIEEKFLDILMQHLERYIKLSKTIVEKEDCLVYFDLDGDYEKSEGELLIPQKKGQLVITRKDFKNTVLSEEFTLFRLNNNIPLHGIDYQNELLLNVDEKDFVSFTKGCFLGQEFISKVHSRSKPSWKLVVKSQDQCGETEKEKMTSKVVDPATGKTIGFIFVSNR